MIKRKKKKLPRGRVSRGRARRRLRQLHVSGSPGDVLLCAVFPLFVVRPEMPCIMAGMDQKDRCSGLFKAGIDGCDAPRAVFSSSCSSSWPVWTRGTISVACARRVWLVTMHLALFSLPWFAGP